MGRFSGTIQNTAKGQQPSQRPQGLGAPQSSPEPLRAGIVQEPGATARVGTVFITCISSVSASSHRPWFQNVDARLDMLVIIYCFKVVELWNKSLPSVNIRRRSVVPKANRIAERDYMKDVFRNLGTMTDDKFIRVWESLEPVIQAVRSRHRQDNTPKV